MNDGWNNQKYPHFWWVAFGFASVNMINMDFKEGCFLLWKKHVLFLAFMFCKFSIMMALLLNCVVVFVLLSNLGVWCVMLILIHCVVLLLKEKDNGELVIGDGKKDSDEFNKNGVVLNKVDFSRSK
jgi:hypothetical protein